MRHLRPRCPSIGPNGYRCRRREHGPVPPEPLPPVEDCHRDHETVWDDETASEPPWQCVSMGGTDTIWDVAVLQAAAADAPVIDLPVAQYLDPDAVNRRFSYWRTVDIHTPIILAPHPQTGRMVVLDGRHRLFKAWKQGRPTVRAAILSTEQERAARLAPDEVARWNRLASASGLR